MSRVVSSWVGYLKVIFLNSMPFSSEIVVWLVGVDPIYGFRSITSKTFLAQIKALTIVGIIGITLPNDIIDI